MTVQYMTRPRSAPSTTPPPSALKKSLRDVQRFLSRDNLAADIRQHQERKLKAIQIALSDKDAQESERQHMIKYRMVRFFETKKALRRLDQLKKQPAEKVSQASLVEATMNLNYVYYFPKTLKYISLFPNVPTMDAQVNQQKEKIRSDIAAQVASGVLENAYEIFARKSRSDAQMVPQDKQGGGGDTEDDDDDEEEEEGEDEEGEGEEEDEFDEDEEEEDEDDDDEEEEAQGGEGGQGGEDEDETDEDDEDEDEPEETDDDDEDEEDDEDEDEEEEDEESEDEAADKKKRQKR